MRSALVSPKEYRAFAAQCSRWAARANREEHRSMMLQMADHWLQKAQELEDASASVPSGRSLISRPSQDDSKQPI